MVSTLNINKTQEYALNNQLSVVGSKGSGSILKAALHNGFMTNFQGCYLSEVITATPGETLTRAGVDFDLNPYVVKGVKQLMTLRGSSATIVPTAGFNPASAAGDSGNLRLTNLVADGASGVAMFQENALWIAPSTDFSVTFDVKQWATRGLSKNIAFSEMGVVGTCVATDVYNATIPLGYVNGSLDKTSVMIQLSSDKGRLVYKPNALALPTAEVTADFDIPAGAFSLRMDYNAAANNGTPELTVSVNDIKALMNSGKYASAVVGDLTFTEVVIGVRPTLYTISFVDTVLAGAEAVSIVGNVIEIAIEATASTATQVKTAWNADAAAMAIATCTIAAGQDAIAQIAVAATDVTGGANVTGESRYSMPITLTGPLQLAARACHNVDYVALDHPVAPILDIDSIFVTIG